MPTVNTPEQPGADAGAAGATALGRRRLLQLAAILLLVLLLELAGLLLSAPDQGQPAVSAASYGHTATTGGDFIISGEIAPLPDCSGVATLVPGVDRCLVYTVRNPGPAPIAVTSISISKVGAPDVCPVSVLDLERTTFTGTLMVAAGGTATVSSGRIALRDTGENQDACKGAEFTFTFTGTARRGAGPT